MKRILIILIATLAISCSSSERNDKPVKREKPEYKYFISTTQTYYSTNEYVEEGYWIIFKEEDDIGEEHRVPIYQIQYIRTNK